MQTRGAALRYRQLDAALLRASTQTISAVPRPWPADDDDADAWAAWLGAVWSQPSVAEAVSLASPVLAERLDAVSAGARPSARRIRRLSLALARYLVRMRGRATPFGIFAGVAPLRFGADGFVCWSDGHQTRIRPDGAWMASVIQRLESCDALLGQLAVVVNDQTTVRRDRLVVTWQPPAGRDSADEVSTRHSPAVRTVLLSAADPILVTDLVKGLAAEYSDAPERTLRAMVAALVSAGVLVSELRPASTCTDDLAHVLGRLPAPDISDRRDTAHLMRELHAIRTQLDTANRDAKPGNRSCPPGIANRMRAISTAAEQPLVVDLRLGATVTLPAQVATEAAAAADALMRLTPMPTGSPVLREYHRLFLDRYGHGAVVPVDQLIHPVTGLGYPHGYQDTGRSEPRVALSGRDEQLLALAQDAALNGTRELVLDGDVLDALVTDEKLSAQPPPHVDVWVDVRAPSMAELAAGEFTLGVRGIGRTAAAFGRFLDLLHHDDRQRIVDLYNELPTSMCGAITAQLSFPPREPRLANTVRAPHVLPHVITLAEHHDREQGLIPVRDLAVTADSTRMYVLSLSRRQVIEPLLPHAGARHTMPALARLLLEIPRALGPVVAPFDWGAARCLPFLPRVRYGRSILAPAQWRLRPSELPGPSAPTSAWIEAMSAARTRLHLPATVSVGTGDRQLRLDLDDPMDLALLRAHLDAANNTVLVTEAPASADHGWFDGRAHEIVIPLAATAPPARVPTVLTGSAPLPIVAHHQRAPSGEQVMFAKLYLRPEMVDEVLIGHLPDLLAAWDERPAWWFVRYLDPTPHLRLRLHVSNHGQAAGRIEAWAGVLRRRGLVSALAFENYEPEIGRYGVGPAMSAAEALFAADSAAVLAQLTALANCPDRRPQALTASSLVNLACALMGSRPAGMRWLLEHPDLAGHAAVRDRDVLRQTLQLSEPSGLHGVPEGSAIAAVWQTRAAATASYAARLGPAQTHVRPSAVLASLLHMHYVRAHGINPSAEAATHRLARAVALAWNARSAALEGIAR